MHLEVENKKYGDQEIEWLLKRSHKEEQTIKFA